MQRERGRERHITVAIARSSGGCKNSATLPRHTGSGTGEGALSQLRASSGTPLKLAMTARDCAEAVYGLWQVREPVPGPGLRLTELLNGAERYVTFAPEQTTGLAPWAVLLGAIAAVDGIQGPDRGKDHSNEWRGAHAS